MFRITLLLPYILYVLSFAADDASISEGDIKLNLESQQRVQAGVDVFQQDNSARRKREAIDKAE